METPMTFLITNKQVKSLQSDFQFNTAPVITDVVIINEGSLKLGF